ncbi:type II secretion system major pseudopilin GspG [Ruegeria marina]|uniref:Type II secretion system core protein G n=1 Tax=Ruegeria marina TaxID=639004 RepID=A0A1G7CE29_9RHOB|nr:type II secretion system major pseudopilin GspG [Ruegeria marina]SDE37598.1 general secretion pathway protein G [Ruegeria marina]
MQKQQLAVQTKAAANPADEGFSLLELMVVVVILSVLALAIVPRVIDRPDQARAARAQSDIAALSSAVSLYRLDNFVYPTTAQGLSALVAPPSSEPLAPNWASGGYIARLPKDPWGREYLYLQPGVHGAFDIFSHGADGQPGGTGANSDIGSWQSN